MRTPAVGALLGQVANWAVILVLVLVCSDSALAHTSGAPQFATGQQTPSSPSAGKPDIRDPSVMPLPAPETAASGNHSWRQRGTRILPSWTISSGVAYGVGLNPAVYVVRSRAAWDQFWQEAVERHQIAMGLSAHDIPVVDFDQYTVMVIALSGRQEDRRVELVPVLSNAELAVIVRECSIIISTPVPEKYDPYTIVAIPKIGRDISVKQAAEVSACSPVQPAFPEQARPVFTAVAMPVLTLTGGFEPNGRFNSMNLYRGQDGYNIVQPSLLPELTRYAETTSRVRLLNASNEVVSQAAVRWQRNDLLPMSVSLQMPAEAKWVEIVVGDQPLARATIAPWLLQDALARVPDDLFHEAPVPQRHMFREQITEADQWLWRGNEATARSYLDRVLRGNVETWIADRAPSHPALQMSKSEFLSLLDVLVRGPS